MGMFDWIYIYILCILFITVPYHIYIYVHLDMHNFQTWGAKAHGVDSFCIYVHLNPSLLSHCSSCVGIHPRGFSTHQVIPSARLDSLKKKCGTQNPFVDRHSHQEWQPTFFPLPSPFHHGNLPSAHLGVKAIEGTRSERTRRSPICVCPEQVRAKQGDGYSITYELSLWEIQQAQGICPVLEGSCAEPPKMARS